MKLIQIYSLGLLFVVTLFSLPISAEKKSSGLDMSNTAQPLENLITGGQPSRKDLEKLAGKGVKVVINLRTKGEFEEFDEKILVEQLGMKYVSIEVDGSAGIDLDNAKKLDEALANLEQPTLLHCASSNRVGGLLAYRAFKLQHQAAEDAMVLGRKAGMTSTAKKVQSLLESKSN